MEHKRGVRYEGPVAAVARAAYVGRPMLLRVEVVTEVTLALEGPLTLGAVGVYVAIVCLELCIGVEWLYYAVSVHCHSESKRRGAWLEGKWDICRAEKALPTSLQFWQAW